MLWRMAFIVSLLAITIGSLLPGSSVSLPANDKLVHALAYALLSLVWCLSQSSARGRYFWGGLAGLWCWGGLIELAQTLVPDRSGGWEDLLANSFGLLAGLMLYQLWRLCPSRSVNAG